MPQGVRWTEEQYRAAAAELRAQAPRPNFSAISRKLGRSRASIVRAWERGWPARQWPSVKQLLVEEQQAAAAPAVDDPEARKREQAKNDAVMIGVDEVRVVRASQQNGMAGLAAV